MDTDRLLAGLLYVTPVVTIWLTELVYLTPAPPARRVWFWGAMLDGAVVYHAYFWLLFAVCWLSAYRLSD